MKNQRERGIALVAVMLLVCVVGTIASLGQSRTLRLAKDTARQKGEAEALYAAEGGLAKARHAWQGRTCRKWMR